MKKYLTLNNLSYLVDKIKTYLTSSTYLNSIGIANSDIDDIADDAGYSSGSLPASEDIFITGDIIPNTDNSVDLGASSKNIKMLYTKGITINGTQFLPSDYATLSDLATVATSGSYADLSNKPSIPVIDSALSSTSENGLQNKAIKSALDGKANSTHTHSASDITSGTLNTDRIPNLDASKITSGTIDIARLPAGAFTPSSHTHSASDITSGLASVATSGSYEDLTNKPTIPVIDSALSSTSTNGLQNKVIKSALDGKANSTHSHNVSDITNLSENWTVTGENLNISFGTNGSTWVYDANTKHLTIS